MSKDRQEVVIKIGGEAGFGIKVAGLILGKALFGNGLYVFGYSEYPSLIRGGHNVYQLNISKKPVYSPTKRIDILMALNLETVQLHIDELSRGGVILHDSLELNKFKKKEVEMINIPLSEMAKKAGAELTRNIVGLGAIMALLGLDLDIFNYQLEDEFGDKGGKIVEINRKAASLGYEYIKKQKTDKATQEVNISNWKMEKRQKNDLLLTANEATALGIIKGGCKFYAAYPMTPATSIMHILAEKQQECGMVVYQSEDEIAAIGAAIGASLCGVRAVTGTSGGGFALMNEGLSLAGMTETPLVVIESQRPAPATGLPTWTEQADLKYVISAGHGEFPRFVLAPGDASEAFYMIQEVLNWVEKYQVPAIFLLDKLLSESDFVLEGLDQNRIKVKREGFLDENELSRLKDYRRYELNKNGISKRAVPGQVGGVHVANSDEHDEYGYSTEDNKIRKEMVNKRFLKLEGMRNEMPEPKIYGETGADLTLVGWGSVKGVVIDMLSELQARGLKVNFLHMNYIWPMPERRIKAVLERAKKILLIENNKTGQLGELIRQQTGFEIKNKLLKYDGRPFFRDELIREIKKYL